MGIESDYSLYPYPLMKGNDKMILDKTYCLSDVDSNSNPRRVFPSIVEHSNGDGTYTGRLNLSQMSTKDKFRAVAHLPLQPIKYGLAH